MANQRITMTDLEKEELERKGILLYRSYLAIKYAYTSIYAIIPDMKGKDKDAWQNLALRASMVDKLLSSRISEDMEEKDLYDKASRIWEVEEVLLKLNAERIEQVLNFANTLTQ